MILDILEQMLKEIMKDLEDGVIHMGLLNKK